MSDLVSKVAQAQRGRVTVSLKKKKKKSFMLLLLSPTITVGFSLNHSLVWLGGMSGHQKPSKDKIGCKQAERKSPMG